MHVVQLFLELVVLSFLRSRIRSIRRAEYSSRRFCSFLQHSERILVIICFDIRTNISYSIRDIQTGYDTEKTRHCWRWRLWYEKKTIFFFATIFQSIIFFQKNQGKTCLLIVFSKDQFPEVYVPTVFENYVSDIEIDGRQVSLFFFLPQNNCYSPYFDIPGRISSLGYSWTGRL